MRLLFLCLVLVIFPVMSQEAPPLSAEIAYLTTDGTLYLLDTNNNTTREIGQDIDEILGWSPEGNYLAVRDSDHSMIRVMDADGETVFSIEIAESLRFGNWHWSPDGTRAFYTGLDLTSEDTVSNVMLVDTESGEVTDTIVLYDNERPQGWLPGGEAILMEQFGDLLRYDLAAETFQFLTGFAPGYIRTLSWHPEGEYVYFITDQSSVFGALSETGTDRQCLFALNLDDQSVDELYCGGTDAPPIDVTVSPNGTYIAAVSQFEIAILEVDSDEVIVPVSEDRLIMFVFWLEDDRLGYTLNNDITEVYAVDITGTERELLSGLENVRVRCCFSRPVSGE